MTITNGPAQQWLDESPLHEAASLALLPCGYRNASDRMVIVRCCGPDTFYLERVVFPFELLSFEAPEHTEVEIWTHGLGGPELLETLASGELLIEPAAVESGGDFQSSWIQAG